MTYLENILKLLEQTEEQLFTFGADYNHQTPQENGSPYSDDKILANVAEIKKLLYVVSNKTTEVLQKSVAEMAWTSGAIYSYVQELINYIEKTFGVSNVA